MMKEFKQFLLRGNILDLAVAVVVGAAFNKIVGSLVADIIMPPLGLLIGGVDFTDLSILLKAASSDAAAVTINYGKFIQTIVDFIIIGFAIFMVIKAYNTLQRKKEEAPEPVTPLAPSKEEVLLTEIRDAIRENKSAK